MYYAKNLANTCCASRDEEHSLDYTCVQNLLDRLKSRRPCYQTPISCRCTMSYVYQTPINYLEVCLLAWNCDSSVGIAHHNRVTTGS